MKFLNPIVAPFLYPLYEKVVTYFWGAEAVQAGSACPIRPSKNKKPAAATDGDASSSKSKEE